MANLQRQFQTPLSSEEGLQELGEQNLKEVTGGVIDPKPFLSTAEKDAAKFSGNTGYRGYLPPVTGQYLVNNGLTESMLRRLGLTKNSIVPHPADTRRG